MIIRSKAPFRVSFGGGGTDMEPYCLENGGCVINTAIDRHIYVTIESREDNLIKVNSVDEFDYDIDVTMKNFPAKYELGEISATLEQYNLSVSGLTPPKVIGDGIVRETHYFENFSEVDEGWIILEAFFVKSIKLIPYHFLLLPSS